MTKMQVIRMTPFRNTEKVKRMCSTTTKMPGLPIRTGTRAGGIRGKIHSRSSLKAFTVLDSHEGSTSRKILKTK